ncbi:hypothetical protein [Desulfosarcina cetonica]|uniref:hypothetical protein n=1 Tax=Desulfosarcina cetonica TaxID=90730 RepID=UPI003BEECE5E
MLPLEDPIAPALKEKSPPKALPANSAISRFKVSHLLGIDTATPDGLARTLPFMPADATAGSENEYQTAVLGHRQQVDLSLAIEDSSFFRNLKKRIQRGDAPPSRVTALERFLESNTDRVWENSWVRLPVETLCLMPGKSSTRICGPTRAGPTAPGATMPTGSPSPLPARAACGFRSVIC